MDITPSRRKWLFVATALAVMMVDMDVTAANLALSTIATDLGFGLSAAQWIIDGYMIAAASLMALGGRLCDIVGSKLVFLGGLVLLAISSLGVGLAVGEWSVIVARIIQGSCIAFTFPVALVIVRQVFPPSQRGFVIGLMVAVAGLSQALGPTLGGVIITFLSWRWIFLLNIPLTILAFLITFFRMPDSKPLSKEPIPYGVAMIFSLGLLAFMTAINEVSRFGVRSIEFILLMMIALSLLSLFAVIEWRARRPVLNFHLFAYRNFLWVNVVRFITNFIYFSLLFVLGLLLQNFLGLSALHAGYLLLSLTLVCGVTSILVGKCVDVVGPKRLIIVGNLLFMASLLLLSTFGQQTPIYGFIFTLILAGLGIAMLVPSTGVAVMLSTPPEKSGAAMGIFLTGGFIGGSVGVAISGWILTALGMSQLNTFLSSLSLQMTPEQYTLLTHAASGVQRLAEHSSFFSETVFKALNPITSQAFLWSFRCLMWSFSALLWLSLLAAGCLSFSKKK